MKAESLLTAKLETTLEKERFLSMLQIFVLK